MNFNTDGFDERMKYIQNANEINRLKKAQIRNIDNFEAKSSMEENNFDKKTSIGEINVSRDQFVLKNSNISKTYFTSKSENTVSGSLNKNNF